ncbi:MAG: phage late control D family protein [Desulfovibrionaceae bacterium]
MRPIFRITADAKDVTAAIKDRLGEITVVDEAGDRSDRVTIVIDNRDDKVPAPRMDATLEVWLGYEETGLGRVGTYTADSVRESGWPKKLAVAGKAANMRKELSRRRTQSYDDTTLGRIVSQIAGRHGLTPVVGSGLSNVAVPHVDQTSESDLHLLTRLGKTHGAVATTKDNRLLFMPQGEAKNASGKDMPTIAIAGKDVINFTMAAQSRGKYGAVVAKYHDQDSAERAEVTVGDGDAVFRLPGTYASEGEASQAAQAKLDALERGVATLELTVPGRTDLTAGGLLAVSGIGRNVDGEWLIKTVTHRFTTSKDGYRVDIEAETPKGKPKGLV